MRSNNKLALSAAASLIALYLLLNVCSAETHDVLCKAGNTRFEAYFHTGIDLIVGPVGKGGLAEALAEACARAADPKLKSTGTDADRLNGRLHGAWGSSWELFLAKRGGLQEEMLRTGYVTRCSRNSPVP